MKGNRLSLALSVLLLSLINIGCSSEELSSRTFSTNSVNSDQTPQTTEKTKDTSTISSSKLDLIDWTKSSEGVYPDIKGLKNIWIDVSIGEQKIYIKHDDQTIYTMITSSGIDTNSDTTTPKGTYYVQAERGKWFYSPKYNEGAEYWVSWKNHGEFLFHSVPMDKNHQVIVEDAMKLGQKDSHGCFHLTIPDAKWIYDNIPKGTKVVIHD